MAQLEWSKNSKNLTACHYYHTDQIGIPRELTDENGELCWYRDYTGWGKLKNSFVLKKGIHQPFRLQNQYCDEETGLHYNFFRYYEPNIGRFTQLDPIGLAGGDNLYAFAPNAMGWIDPLGLSKKSKRSCDEISEDIDRLINRNKRACGKCGGTHGLRYRFDGQINGLNGPGTESWNTHEQEIKNQQKNLRKYLDEWNDSGCGDPPNGAWKWVTKPVPTEKEWKDPNQTEKVVVVFGVVGGGYIAYRIIRVIPSLLPPLWWSLPMNVAAP